MKFLLGKKIEMAQRFRDDGSVVPVTRIAVSPCTVTQIRTPERDGYSAIQIGVGSKRHNAKPQIGHTKALGRTFAHFQEFRADDVTGATPGKEIALTTFTPGEMVTVRGVTKGQGFQGVVKRHGFRGHPASHGHKDQLRMPGSIGSKRQGPVAPGKRMAGRMGGEQVTVHGLEVIAVDTEQNELVVKGAIPGARGTMVSIEADGPLVFVESAAPAVEAEPIVAPEAAEVEAPVAEAVAPAATETPAA